MIVHATDEKLAVPVDRRRHFHRERDAVASIVERANACCLDLKGGQISSDNK